MMGGGWLIRLARAFGKCPPGWKLTRAVSRGLDADIGWHVSSCTRCAAEFRALQKTAAALGALPDRRMSEDAKEVLGSRLLEGALVTPLPPIPERRPLARFAIAMTALVVVAALAAVWAVRRGAASGRAPVAVTPAPRPWLGAVRAIGGARFARVRTRPDEVVRLEDGTVGFEVVRLSAQERFRVITADAEVEVRGTAFEVTAARGKLVGVRVWRGRVEVRAGGGAVTVLDAGDEWIDGSRRIFSSAAAEPAAAPHPAPVRRDPVHLAARALSPSPREGARGSARGSGRGAAGAPSFNDAWSLLRDGKAAQAADAFDVVARSGGDAGVVEDARYWRAVALARAGDAHASRAALVLFLAQFPRSPRAGEASVILGWSLLHAGDLDGARAAFTRGTADAAERVRFGAREGLRQLDAQGDSARSARTSESK